jgi:hypothetical protein
VSISREDLYEKVWSISVTKLAKSYGISDVGLAKACKRHQIPRPPVGYWAQKAVGSAPERPPLPVVVDPKLQTVEFAPGPSRPKEPDELILLQERVPTFDDQELKATYERFREAVPSIAVPDRLRGKHPLIVGTRDSLERSTKGDRYVSRNEQQFLFSPRHDDSKNALDITVAKESFGRALRWWEALLTTLEVCSIRLKPMTESYKRHTRIEAFGENFQIRMRERTKRAPHEPTPKELADHAKYPNSSHWRKWDYRPNGEFLVELLNEEGWSVLRTWDDRKTVKIEDRLMDLVISIFEQVDRLRTRRIAEREAAKRRAEQAERERQAELRRKEEQQCVDALLQEVNDWETSQRIRRYLRSIRRLMAQRQQMIESGSELDTFLVWAEQVASRFDPLHPSETSVSET